VKQRDDVIVGATVLIALIVIVGGALWLGQAHLGRTEEVYTARFHTVGGLSPGDPVVLRGVRVGRVRAIRLGQKNNWVEAELQIYSASSMPAKPAVIAASSSLFGEWQAGIVPFDQPLDDPTIRKDLDDAAREGGDMWPGAALPDIGQLTAQAGRIAGDIASVSSRIQSAFDSQAVGELQRSMRDFGKVADQLSRFTQQQTNILGEVGTNLRQGSDVLADAAQSLSKSLARVDSATNQGELTTILTNAQQAAVSMRQATENFNQLMKVAGNSQASVQRIIENSDTILSRIANRKGTAGLVIGDTTLYVETTKAVVQLEALLKDIQSNPRKYFSFKVF
jgi:phospholipid/cholesterol/gamma-HCH transport system substrate-binding protein